MLVSKHLCSVNVDKEELICFSVTAKKKHTNKITHKKKHKIKTNKKQQTTKNNNNKKQQQKTTKQQTNKQKQSQHNIKITIKSKKNYSPICIQRSKKLVICG
jgi:hypothetical protein